MGGDDSTDELMFSALNAKLGKGDPRLFTVTVGRKPSEASSYLDGHAEVVSLLELFCSIGFHSPGGERENEDGERENEDRWSGAQRCMAAQPRFRTRGTHALDDRFVFGFMDACSTFVCTSVLLLHECTRAKWKPCSHTEPCSKYTKVNRVA